MSEVKLERAGLIRRIGAWVYDALVITAIMLLASGLGILFIHLLNSTALIEFEAGQDLAEYARTNLFYQAWLALCFFSFYIWFWRRGGQTAGLKTWRLQIRSLNGQPLTHIQCLLRLAFSFFGLGNLLVLLPPFKKRALQDIASGTEVIVLSKEDNKHVNWKGYM
ncbi:RDD family protein [Gayadomonas joobiniege]|uniref:RDD family protein n=1 Tax=Gayadomonas joobiniege TaxID=1234606 RepID=UPI000380F660|nr:RDD family protein [Gayadomonas joobiniege]